MHKIIKNANYIKIISKYLKSQICHAVIYVLNMCVIVNYITKSPLLKTPGLSFKIKKMNLVNITTPIVSCGGQVLSVLPS